MTVCVCGCLAKYNIFHIKSIVMSGLANEDKIIIWNIFSYLDNSTI